MMKPFVTLFFIVSVLGVFPSYARQQLSCKDVVTVQRQFLRDHIRYTSITPELKYRIVDQFIKNLDRDKIYFLQSDVGDIRKRTTKLFFDLNKKECHVLYYIYRVYSKRVKERIKFANQYLGKNFKFERGSKYILDRDIKKHGKSSREANQLMKSYIQYQAAHMFLVEEDLEKTLKQIKFLLNNRKKQILSWEPQLNPKERRICREKSKAEFKSCKPTKWFSQFLKASGQSLDVHSTFLDSDDLEEFYIDMNLELEGIGATLTSQFGYTVVERLLPGGPAYKSKKVKKKDKILAVGQNRTKLIDIFGKSLEDVVSKIRGPKGTDVFLKISRENKKGKPSVFVVKLTRDKVELDEHRADIFYRDIKSKGKTYKIALLRVPSFYGSSAFYGKSVTRDVIKLLHEAKEKNIDSLVLDLSNNRGGALDGAVDVSGLFFSEGNVVKQSAKNQPFDTLRDLDKRIIYNGPLIVLVSRLSASASEIVAGTLQDYKRAVIVGADHTFGKGSVQSVEPLKRLVPQLGALKTTVGLYFIPSGKSTQKAGVSSDIIFPSLLHIEEFGEHSLDHVLPTQTIQSFKSSQHEIFSQGKNNWQPVNDGIIEQLRKASSRRIAKNKEFQKIKKRLTKLQKKAKNQKIITIAEVLDDKDEELSPDDEDTDISQSEKHQRDKKYLSRPDIQEALNVARDLILIQNKKNNKKVSI